MIIINIKLSQACTFLLCLNLMIVDCMLLSYNKYIFYLFYIQKKRYKTLFKGMCRKDKWWQFLVKKVFSIENMCLTIFEILISCLWINSSFGFNGKHCMVELFYFYHILYSYCLTRTIMVMYCLFCVSFRSTSKNVIILKKITLM